MTILFVDHHDSFVYNLISWFKKNSGQKILVVDPDNLDEVKKNFLSLNIRCVIFSPGPGNPLEYKNSLSFYQWLPNSIPFLGVCLGYQIMLCAYNASIEQVAKIPIHGKQFRISKKISSRLLPQDAFEGYLVLYHSLGVATQNLVFQKHFNLLVSHGKYSMAAEHVTLPHLGVQFHPESFASSQGEYFLQCFLRLIHAR